MNEPTRVLFLCGTHGNEAFSVPVLEELVETLPREDFNYDYITANPEAVKANVRFIDVDMNRSAPGNLKSRLLEERRAAEVIAQARDFDAVVDIHGASSDCGITTLTPLPTTGNLQLALGFGQKRNVIWHSKRSLNSGPLAQHIGKAAIEVECGSMNDPKTAAELGFVLQRFLIAKRAGLLPSSPTNEQEFYEVFGKLKEYYGSLPLADFEPQITSDGSFFPYLSNNTYHDIACYMMQRVSYNDIVEKYKALRI